jgi:PEP-CTERM motif
MSNLQKSRYRHHRRPWQFLLVLFSLVALSGLLTITVVRYRWVLKQMVRVVAGSHATGIEAYVPAPNARAERTIHPYSVIPGGVASIDEVQASVQRDPVVARHYRGISPYALHFERLPVPVHMYASYRIGQSVYWTNHRILVPRGELVLRDESHFIRARCGNLLAFDLPPGVTKLPPPQLEPPDLVFDYGTPPLMGTTEPAPAEPVRLAKGIPALPTIGSTTGTTGGSQMKFWPPVSPPPVWCCGSGAANIPQVPGGGLLGLSTGSGTPSSYGQTSPISNGHTSPVAPEPASYVLMLSAVGVAILARRRA